MAAHEDTVVVEDKAAAVDAAALQKAAAAEAAEHSMTLASGWRTHRRAIFWSMALSFALIMEGYDVVVIGAPHSLSADARLVLRPPVLP
jgi:SP family general alpha glucoside:H+ symporter-like MFS transporter